MSKLETESINENIKNTSSDDPHDNREIEYMKAITGPSMQNSATKTKLAIINFVHKI